MTTTTTMTATEAAKLVADAKAAAPKIEALAKSRDHAPQNPDGTYTGEVVRLISVSLRLTDARTGNGVSETVTDPAANMAEVVKCMQRKLAAMGKATRAAIRAERSID